MNEGEVYRLFAFDFIFWYIGNMKEKLTNEDLAKLIENLAISVDDSAKLIENLAISTANGFNGVKSEIKEIKQNMLNINDNMNELRNDWKSFRKDIGNDMKELNINLEDSNDTIINHDKRIEHLETKVFA